MDHESSNTEMLKDEAVSVKNEERVNVCEVSESEAAEYLRSKILKAKMKKDEREKMKFVGDGERSGLQPNPNDPSFKEAGVIVNTNEIIKHDNMNIPNAWMCVDICPEPNKVLTGDSDLDSGTSEPHEMRVYTGSINTKQECSEAKQVVSRSYVYYKICCRRILPRAINCGLQEGVRCVCTMTARMSEMVQKVLTNKPYEMVSRNLRFDLSAIIHRAAMCIALHALSGQISENDLTGGKRGTVFPASVNGVIEYKEGGVFIPQLMAQTSFYTTAVLIRLCWGCNAIVSAVDVKVAGDANIVVLPTHRLQNSADSLYEIVDYMFNMYNECGRGNEAALAFTAGIHSVMTVKGHTMEGGILRDAFREISFAPPFGVTIPMSSEHGALSLPRVLGGVGEWSSFVSQTDSFALATAALASVSDPGSYVNGASIPTVIQSTSGVNDMSSDEWRNEIIGRQYSLLLDITDSFSLQYVENLGRMMGMDNNVERWRAANILSSAFESSSISHSRHLEYAVLCPWTWIEPTSILSNVRWANSIGYEAGWGLFCEDTENLLPSLDGAKVKQLSHGTTRYVMPAGPLRRHAFIQHVSKSKKNGLVFMRASYVDKHGVLMRGQSRQWHNVEHSHTNSLEFDAESSYTSRMDMMLWGKTDNNLISPGECVFTHPWYLDVRSDCWCRMTDQEEHVLDGSPAMLQCGIKAWSNKPILDSNYDRAEKEWPQVKRRNVAIQALLIARQGIDTTIKMNIHGEDVIGKYKDGVNKAKIHDSTALRTRILYDSMNIAGGLPSRMDTLLQPARSNHPKNYIEAASLYNDALMAGSRVQPTPGGNRTYIKNQSDGSTDLNRRTDQ